MDQMQQQHQQQQQQQQRQQQQVAVGKQSSGAIQRRQQQYHMPVLQIPDQKRKPQTKLVQAKSSSSSSSSSTSNSANAPSPTNMSTTTASSGGSSQLASQPCNTNQKQQSQQHPNFVDDRYQKISFHLKTSIFTRQITIDSDKMALGLIKQLAMAFLNEIYFDQTYPPETYIGDYIRKNFTEPDNFLSLYERLVLRKYLPEQDTLVPFNSVSDINQNSY